MVDILEIMGDGSQFSNGNERESTMSWELASVGQDWIVFWLNPSTAAKSYLLVL